MSPIEITPLADGVAVRFPYDPERKDRLRHAFPKARWSPDQQVWIIPGKRAVRRASAWQAEEEALEKRERLEEEKARDALAFDPLPESPWVRVTAAAILVETPYAPALVHMLRGLGGSWCETLRAWRLPFRSAERLRAVLPELDRLATDAQAEAEKRKAELEALRAKAQARREERERERREELRRKTMARAFNEPPRPLRREFMMPRPGAPKHHFEMELFDLRMSRSSRLLLAKVEGRGESWLAQIWASCPRYGYSRSFLAPIKDYSRANGSGSRGIFAAYILEEGPIYEVRQQVSWHQFDRYFLRIWDGQRIRMTEEEVRACLEP